ncbi:MAG TPA: hypothetical protein VIX17_11460 [Pyrinomonadaceae bacterium]|jgi:hypothetical protein
MFRIYDKLEDVPEAIREHYKMIGGKAVPEVVDEHPLVVNYRTLLNEKTAAETKASTLETANAGLKADLESAKTHSLPRGTRAVPVAEVEAMEKLKEHGSATEIVSKLTEHKTLKEESQKRAKEDHGRKVAEALNFDPDLFVMLPNLPDCEIREKDGKKTVIAKVKDGDTVTERPLLEFMENSAEFAKVLSKLKTTTGGIPVPGGTRDSGKPAANIYSDIREDAKKRAEKKDTSVPLSARQGLRVIGERAA